MLLRTPLSAAVLGVFCAPIATTALAQSAAPSVLVAQAGTPAASNTAAAAPGKSTQDTALPAVSVTGQTANDFSPAVSNVGAKTPTALRDIPQTVTVINRALLDSQAANSFQDALRNVPGVTLGAAEGGTIGNNINLRGFTARTDIYLDGFRDRGQYYRDTFDLEQVEVLFGPSSMLFGRGSTGGVINQESKKANLTAFNEVTAMVGTHDQYRSSFDVNHAISDTAAIRINGFGQSLESTRNVESSKDYGFAPEIRFGIGTPTEITLSALIQHNRDMPDYGLQAVNGRPAAVGKGTFYGLSDDRTIQDVQQFTARIDHTFSPNLKVSNQTRYAHYATDARETAPGNVITAGGTVLTNGNYTSLPLSSLYTQLASHDRVINDHSIYNDTQVTAKFDTGPLKHELIAGVEIGHETYANQAYSRSNLPLLNMADPFVESTPANSVSTIGNLVQSSANSLGVYANDTVSLGKYWKFVGGLRWDRYSASLTNSIASARSGPGYVSQTNYFTSVRTGLIFQPADWQSYYVSYGTSFNPSLEALTVTNFTQTLPPESNRSYEVGGKWDLYGGNLSVTSSLFDITKSNARTQVSTSEYELDGKVRVRGFQTGVTGKITDKWAIYAGYAYLDSEILDAADGTQGHTPANTPRNTATLWSTYSFTPAWTVGGGMTYLSARYASNTNYVSVGGYTRFDAMISFHQPRYDVQLNLQNLTNKYYYDALIPSDGGRAVPGYGRTLLATLKYRF